MIYFDTTKTGSAGHRSGLTRVSSRLLRELGPEATPVQWPDPPRRIEPRDWYVTAELFSEAERPGLTGFLESRVCRCAALFHDAIPLKHPDITWPQSVARHPGYMALLARFDRIWAVSNSSKHELEGFWRWQGRTKTPPVEVIGLGADFDRAARVARRGVSGQPVPRLLCVGIIEPRKNQGLLLDVCEQLWSEGLRFELHVVGRTNPHFGKPLRDRLTRAAHRGVRLHEAADDATLAELYATARATVFPTIAEGCGLPLLESLWKGVPCVCSDLPVLRENADGGGCVAVPANDAKAWADTLRRVVTDDGFVATLTHEAAVRPLATWADTARSLMNALG